MKYCCSIIAAALLCALLLASGCGSSEQEQVWRSFLKAAAAQRADEALSHLDLERMTQKYMSANSDAALGMALLGGSEATAGIVEGMLRDSFAKGEFDFGGTDLSAISSPSAITTKGDFSTLTFQGGRRIEMERIDGEWKIVSFGNTP